MFISVTQRKLQTEAPCETYKNETSCEEKKAMDVHGRVLGKFVIIKQVSARNIQLKILVGTRTVHGPLKKILVITMAVH